MRGEEILHRNGLKTRVLLQAQGTKAGKKKKREDEAFVDVRDTNEAFIWFLCSSKCVVLHSIFSRLASVCATFTSCFHFGKIRGIMNFSQNFSSQVFQKAGKKPKKHLTYTRH